MKKVRILIDDSCEMMRIEAEEECLFEGNFSDFDYESVPKMLRRLGLSVTEEGYEYE